MSFCSTSSCLAPALGVTKVIIVKNTILVTLVVVLKSDLKPGQQSVTQYITMMVMILVTPKAGAEHKLLFNKPASVKDMILVTLCSAT
jgi:hypothetical protein